jgi:putative transposase
VPTIWFQILYVFLVLVHDRRRIVHFAVTAHPTAEWTAQQLREAFPWDTAPRYLLRDRDRIFGADFIEQVEAMGIEQVLSAPRSPWQRDYASHCTSSVAFAENFLRSRYACFGVPFLGRSSAGVSNKHSPLSL